MDGPYEGWGEFTTRALLFQGRELELNYKTSGGGSIQVEIQDEQGGNLEGFQLEDASQSSATGSALWCNGIPTPTSPGLSGKPVRLRVRLRDARSLCVSISALTLSLEYLSKVLPVHRGPAPQPGVER